MFHKLLPLFYCSLVLLGSDPPEKSSLTSLEPARDATGVSPLTSVRVQFARPVKSQTVTVLSFRLLGPKAVTVPAEVNCDLTGGVATLTPVHQLVPNTVYTVELTGDITLEDGGKLVPFRWSFRTGEHQLGEPLFRFQAQEIDPRGQVTACRIGPDGNLYVADVHGAIRRYHLGEDGKPHRIDLPLQLERQQIVGLCFDPEATPDRLLLWVSHARRRAGPWAGVVSRVELPPVGSDQPARRTDVIVGLPCPPDLEHQPNGLAFGPDGRLYQVVGGVSTLGGTPNWGASESLLSAAMIVADVKDPKFNQGRLPCDVTTAPPVNYDPYRPEAPVRLYATGLRNALGLCFHSSGHLFTATNGNSIGSGVFTPSAPGVPAINFMPHEALCRILPGKYYGHPNPSRGECVLLGGNPTRGKDPWEVPVYPVGVKPDPNFNPDLLYDIRPGGGNSANGMCEYTGPGCQGPLRNRLLIAYFSGGRCIQTFAFAADGKVVDERPLVDPAGKILRFNQPLDLCVHPATGRLYVAVFGNWPGSRVGSGVESKGGGVWLLQPVAGTQPTP